ncbi:MAG TPA: metalloregulator ArsR/SmtB family transcription factor [Bacillota bacterium]
MKPGECNIVADLVKALTNPTRLMILCALSGGQEMKVSDIVAKTGARQANISIQLGLLRSKGILTARREEVNVYYGIADHRVLEALELLLAVAKGNSLSPARLTRRNGRS